MSNIKVGMFPVTLFILSEIWILYNYLTSVYAAYIMSNC